MSEYVFRAYEKIDWQEAALETFADTMKLLGLSGFLPQTAPHLSTGCKWYCSSASVASSCNTRRNPGTGAARSQFSESKRPYLSNPLRIL